MRVARACFLAATLFLAGCDGDQTVTTSAPTPASDLPVGSGFDFYVLSLSWSPGYCSSQGERANRQQCAVADPFGFVVHGLWPQLDDGYPEFCDLREPAQVDRQLAQSMFDIMPSRGLIDHQWKKHGSCSGLSQADYFAVTRAAFEKIRMPDTYLERDDTGRERPADVEQAFIDANAIPAQSIAVTCDRRFLRDVRICLSKDLKNFVPCPQVDRSQCRLPQMVVPPN